MTFQQIATLVILLAVLAFAVWAVRVSGQAEGQQGAAGPRETTASETAPEPGRGTQPGPGKGKKGKKKR